MGAKIAFLQFGAAGDIMFATPTLRSLASSYSNAKIEWFIEDRFVNLVETNPYVSKVVPYKRPNIHGQKQADEGIMWQQMKDDADAGDYCRIAKPQMWPDHNFYRSQDHIVDMMAQNVFSPSYEFLKNARYLELYIIDDDIASVSTRFGDINWNKVITINHVSYAASPVWQPFQYEQFAKELLDHDFIPMFTGSASDPLPEVDGIVDARGTTYREWTECISRSACWLGLDTGAKGLAATTDTPMVVLQSPDFQVHKTGIANYGLCRYGKPIYEITVPITVTSAVELITGHSK